MSNTLTAQQESELNATIGKYRTSDSNPCGVSFYFDQGEEKPFRISDDQVSESFSTYDELLNATIDWKDSFDDNNWRASNE